MRVGRLDKSITIERLVETLDEYGVARAAWTPIRTLRAQIIQASAKDVLSSAGEAAASAKILRIRFVERAPPADRIIFNGGSVSINQI